MNSEPPARGQRVEVLLHRGQADVWYRGTVIDGGRVRLDTCPHADPTIEYEMIAVWRIAISHTA